MSTRKRKVIQATEDVQIFVQESIVDEDSMPETVSQVPFPSVKQENTDDEDSSKAADTIINKLGNCEKYLRIIVNLDKQINFLTRQTQLFNYSNDTYPGISIKEDLDASQSSGSKKQLVAALKNANLIFPFKSVTDMLDINERCSADDDLRQQVILFFKSRKQLANTNFRSAMRSFATDACLMECNWRVDHLNTKRKNLDQLDLMRYMYECWFPHKPYASFVLSMKDYFRRVHNRFAKRKQLEGMKNADTNE